MFKYIGYAFKTKKGIDRTNEFVTDVSFGPLEGIFIISFIILGIVTLGLGFLSFFYLSNLALFFFILFLLILVFDIWIFIKVKRFFSKLSKKTVDFSQKKYKEFSDEKVVDVEYE